MACTAAATGSDILASRLIGKAAMLSGTIPWKHGYGMVSMRKWPSIVFEQSPCRLSVFGLEPPVGTGRSGDERWMDPAAQVLRLHVEASSHTAWSELSHRKLRGKGKGTQD